MASSGGTVAARRRSMELFDPTAYAARRKEKVEAAAALREQRKKEQEKRESDRGAVPIPSKHPPVDYTFAPETPRQPGQTSAGDVITASPAPTEGPNYLKPLMRRSLTAPATPPEVVTEEPQKVVEAKPSPNSSSFAQALPPFRSPSLGKLKKRPTMSSPPHKGADPEEPPSPLEQEREATPVPTPEDDMENQAPAPARLAIVEKKPSPAKTALSLLKAKLRLSKPKPAAAAPYQESPPPASAQPPPERAALSPTQGQNQDSRARVQPKPAALPSWAVGDREEEQGGETRADGGSGRLSLGSKLARALGPRKKKDAADAGNGESPSREKHPTRAGRDAQPSAEWQAPENELPEEGDVSTRPCPDCKRNFSEAALAKHAKICRKVFGQKRKAFNVAAHRLEGTDAAKFVQQQGPGRGTKGGASSSNGRGDAGWAQGTRNAESRPLTKVPAWKQQSQQLQAAIQASRQYSQAKAKGIDLASLPPPPPSENLDYVPCPHCSRRFAPQVAERHIPKCKDTVNRPKPVLRKTALGGVQKRKGGK